MTVLALLVRRAEIARPDLRVLRVAGVTVMFFDESPAELGNRASEVDGADVASITAVTDVFRAERRSPLLEIDAVTVGDATRAHLTSLGLALRWVTIELRRPLASGDPTRNDARDVVVRRALASEAESVGDLAIEAFGEPPPGFPRHDREHVRRAWARYCHAPDARMFVASVDGTPCAVGFSLVRGELALVDGAATLPAFRRRGGQTALLAARFDDARSRGARTAITRALEGSASQANLERAGMRVARRFEVWGEASRPA